MTIIGGELIGSEGCCVTAADVVNYKACWSDVICGTNEEIEEHICTALEIVNLYTNRDFCPTTECRVYDGNGTNYLRLDKKLNSFTSIAYTACNSGILPAEDPTAYKDYLHFSCCDYVFPKGHKNITVCGEWGEPVPTGVKEAIILMALEKTNPGLTAMTSSIGKVRSVNWADFSILYAQGKTEKNSTKTTGFLEVDRILDMYINLNSQIGFVSTSEFVHDECRCNRNPCHCHWS